MPGYTADVLCSSMEQSHTVTMHLVTTAVAKMGQYCTCTWPILYLYNPNYKANSRSNKQTSHQLHTHRQGKSCTCVNGHERLYVTWVTVQNPMLYKEEEQKFSFCCIHRTEFSSCIHHTEFQPVPVRVTYDVHVSPVINPLPCRVQCLFCQLGEC